LENRPSNLEPPRMIAAEIAEVGAQYQAPGDVEVEIAIPGGDRLAERTLNGRLGIVGGSLGFGHDRRGDPLFVFSLDPFHSSFG
jgi:Cobalamin biosynthesis protein CbiD